jgi:hypothetical protein
MDFFRWLKRYLFPTAGNDYRPGIFSRNSVLAIAAILIFGQVAWFGVTAFIAKNPNFLGAVLPGVLIALTNGDRAANSDAALTTNALLTKAAQEKANDMAAKGYFAHVSPDGTTPWHWLDQVGYKYSYAGENLAVDFTDSTAVESAWMNSPTHRANIVKPQYTEIGIAVANGTYQGQSATFVVQFFGTPASAPSTLPAKPSVAAVSVPAPAPPVAVATSAPATVLGASVAPVPKTTPLSFTSRVLNAVKTALTSPGHTMTYALGAVIAVVALLLILSILVRFDIQYREMIAGAALLLIIAGGSIFFLEAHTGSVTLPEGGQAASVYVGFQGGAN